MVVTLIIVLPGTNTPQIITTPWQENTSLQATLQAVASAASTSPPLSFAVQYAGVSLSPNFTPGYNLIMLNGNWTSNSSSTPPPQPNYWLIEVNGTPLMKGVDEYLVEAGDVIVFTYNAPAPATAGQ